MIKVIDGKRYNTQTAEKIAEWDNGFYGDFKYCEETLYRTTKGAFFLYGKGNAMSKYATPVQCGTRGGEDITPLSDDQAQQWLEENQLINALEQYFPESIEDA